jgi:hypothetical protein
VTGKSRALAHTELIVVVGEPRSSRKRRVARDREYTFNDEKNSILIFKEKE